MLPGILLFTLSSHALLAQNPTRRDVDDFCWNFRTRIPVVREQMQSPRDAERKPGPRQTAPWFLAGTGIAAVPSDTSYSEIPQTLYRGRRLERLTAQVRNGRLLSVGDAVWMRSSSCSTSPRSYEDNLVTLDMDFITDKAFEFTRAGNTSVSPFVFQLRVPLLDLMAMSDAARFQYLDALLPDDPPATGTAAAQDSNSSGPSNNSGAPPKRVQVGDSRRRVEEILGQPDTIADLGSKVVYLYRALKITFVDGKVSDVQ